jgi:hypothetical protein
VKPFRRYSTQLEADLARIALEAADIPAVVAGVSVGMEGGIGGVLLFVPDDQVEAAEKVLAESHEGNNHAGRL